MQYHLGYGQRPGLRTRPSVGAYSPVFREIEPPLGQLGLPVTPLTKGHLTRRQAGKIIDNKKTFRPILCSAEELAAVED